MWEDTFGRELEKSGREFCDGEGCELYVPFFEGTTHIFLGEDNLGNTHYRVASSDMVSPMDRAWVKRTGKKTFEVLTHVGVSITIFSLEFPKEAVEFSTITCRDGTFFFDCLPVITGKRTH
jgi:hypothetical protein